MRNSGDVCLAGLWENRGTSCVIAILVSLILWNVNVNSGNSGLAAEEWLWHGVLAQGDCSCVVKRTMGMRGMLLDDTGIPSLTRAFKIVWL